jgi:hypothetical protein
MYSRSSLRIRSDCLICWFVRPRLPCATRRVSFRPACIAVSMGQRSRCTLNGAAWKITRRCAGTLRRCPIFSRRSQSQSLIRECTKSSRLSQELQLRRSVFPSTPRRQTGFAHLCRCLAGIHPPRARHALIQRPAASASPQIVGPRRGPVPVVEIDTFIVDGLYGGGHESL